MPSTRFLALAALFLSASASTSSIVPPAQKGIPGAPAPDITHPTTNNTALHTAAAQVQQKTSASIDSVPSDSVPPVVVTAIDGSLVNVTVTDVASSSSTRRRRDPLVNRQSAADKPQRKRSASDYVQVFSGQDAGELDAYIDGTAYLTFTLVNNGTYNVDDCLAFCDSVPGCEFVNLYYEFNNYLLDFVFPQKSNLKCAAYGDYHDVTEKSNRGGQQSYPHGGPPTCIGQSGGWASKELTNPSTPDGYSLVFGPTNGANNAPGYMGFAFLDRYDVDACAALCNSRGYDPVGGVCQYFNIWRAVVNGVPTTYTCSMYYLVADASTAVNYGQGDLVVTYSRGYQRLSILPDGGFEGYNACDDFCFTASYANWIGSSPKGGDFDASIFYFSMYAHTGHSTALLGAANNDDSDSGSLTPATALKTEKGKSYVVQLFVANNFADATSEASAYVDVFWNGKQVGSVAGFQQYTPSQFNVVGTGKDVLKFTGGAAPAWSFIDDVFVALL